MMLKTILLLSIFSSVFAQTPKITPIKMKINKKMILDSILPH